MSFFFNTWAYEGFVLASDVRLLENGEQRMGHKLAIHVSNAKVVCAVAVCGEYPKVCIDFFYEASALKDTLKEVAQHFASKWTQRFAGTQDYSAVHLVGFERIPQSDQCVPQMWYWHNWLGPKETDFRDKSELAAELDSFTDPIPKNNHIPYRIREITGKFPAPRLDDEASLVRSFLRLHEPYFTWNGDTAFWRSATNAVGSAMNLLAHQKSNWSINEVGKITKHCLTFLAQIATFLPQSTVGLSKEMDCDVLELTPQGINTVSWANLDGET